MNLSKNINNLHIHTASVLVETALWFPPWVHGSHPGQRLWFHVDAAQGGSRAPYVLAGTPTCVHRKGPDVRPPKKYVNLASRRRSGKGL